MSGGAEARLDRLADFLRSARDEMLADLSGYVGVETPSDDLAALARGRDWVRTWLPRRLGAGAGVQVAAGGGYGDTLVLDHPGTGRSAGDAPVVVLAHYDTVWPVGTLDQLPFDVTGDTIRGPGVFDMKAGLVQAVWAIRAVDALRLPRPPVRLVVNGDEEVGSPASRPVIEAACRGARAVLVFEASADGAVKTARKGVGLFDLSLTGVEAHAGLDPTAGASAVVALGEFIGYAGALADPRTGATVNVGVVAGGTRRNVTAGSAHAGLDVRVASIEEADRVAAELRRWRPGDPAVRAELDGGWNRPVMVRGPAVAALFDRAAALAGRLGFTLRETAVGGASDGNFAAALGLPVLDGLGAVGAGAHARHEHATVSGMTQRSTLAAALLTDLADPPC
ncbi:M20 family metallopeptidase [Plantactinospora sp. KBS50]|uniref:M20 family metallopeptidase n=1 Tax=Plantactinospora sp. KBS50 TaxID=2024580 RepID=UPI000BAAF01F|nr:M20 family metallopeptidase [Plantactinospora sp. KBS50]ASW55384.1 peptidase M20 [Plantactinospora sp. KBS50]